MRRPAIIPALGAALLAASAAWAHETRPGYLEIAEEGPEAYRVLWKVPAREELRLSIRPVFPDGCAWVSDPISFAAGEFFSERRALLCPGGLTGKTIRIDGLNATETDVLVRVVWRNGTTQTALLKPSAPAFTVEASPGTVQVAATYLRLGVEHILLGIDHLLFVLALLLLVKGARRILATVTAFTLAHSLTLGVAALGFARVPQQPVEAVIALSIVFVAMEILHVGQGRASLTERWPWVVAFIFGLLHGFGFAGALSEVGLPAQAIPLALLFFNVGVEAGQLLFIASVLLLAAALRRVPVATPAWVLGLPAYGIGAVAAYWTIERVAGFWGQ